MLHVPSDLATLSRLLDEALDLEPSQVEAWLASLPPEHGPLLARLREMLAEHLSDDRTPFLSGGPQLEGGPVDGSVARAGDLVGPYRLIGEIGSGGMGAVWLAERADGSLKRHIALKLPRLAWGAGLAERMVRERDIGALLEHPNIARLYDAGVDTLGRPYLAFEYIDGQALDEWCEAKALTVAERLRLFLQVVRAVAYAHGRLVVHRDLKPSNVLVTPDGQAHLLDFGIAKLLQEGASGGDRLTQEQGRVFTPHFASPEQLRGEAITVASDVYSLGVLLYDLLTGQHPYAPERKSLGALEQAILEGEPALASSRVKDKVIARQLHGELDSILAKALKRDPSQRYATADALAEDIERHLHGERVLAQPDSVGYRMAKTLRRHRVGFGAAAAIAVAVLSGAGVAIVQAKRASDSAERARVVKEFVVDVFKVNSRDNPANNELRQLPAELLLERGAKLIETKFPGQPLLQAELFGVVGGIFADMGATQLAADYATHQVETLATIRASEVEQAQATMLLAQALASQGRLADAEIRARRALELAGASSLLSAQARIGLAEVLFARLNDAGVTKELDEADQVLATITRAPTIEAARGTFLRAQLLNRHGKFKEAGVQFERAIDSAVQIDGPLARSVIAMRLKYVDVLIPELQAKEAETQFASALAAMRATGGPDDIGAALAEASMADLMFDYVLIPGDEAVATLERARAVVAGHGRRAPEAIRARLDFLLGETLAEWGNVERGYPLLEQAVRTLRAGTESKTELGDLSLQLGSTLTDVGRHAEADKELRAAFETIKSGSPDDHRRMATGLRYLAENLRMQGRFDEAEAALQAALDLGGTREASGGFALQASIVVSDLALVQLERGDPASALQLLSRYDDRAEFDRYAGFGPDAELVRAECWCVLGRAREGLPVLEKFAAKVAERGYVHDFSTARLRALTGLCALKTGDRKRAVELSELARRAFTAQPGVSPYFKAPLVKLEQSLRGHATG